MDTQIEARDPETPGDGVGRTAQVFEIFGETEDASDELGLLIGRRGETLGALQYLLNVVTTTPLRRGQPRLLRRCRGLQEPPRDARSSRWRSRVAAEVRDTGDVITLEPMKPAERRIVHLTLSEEPGVTTESVGSGNDRQVEVLPTDYDDDYDGGHDDYDDDGEQYDDDGPVAEDRGDDAVDEYDEDDPADEDGEDDRGGDDDEPVDEYDDEDGEDDRRGDDDEPVDEYDDDEDDEGPNR